MEPEQLRRREPPATFTRRTLPFKTQQQTPQAGQAEMEPELRRREPPTTFTRRALPFKTQQQQQQQQQQRTPQTGQAERLPQGQAERLPRGQGPAGHGPTRCTAPPRQRGLGHYSAPTLSEEELAAVEVPYDRISVDLEPALAEHGFAVVTDVVEAWEVGSFEDAFLEDLLELIDGEAAASAAAGVREAYARLLEEGPIALPLRTATEHLTQGTGLCLDRCLPHGRFAWRARAHPRVRAGFRALFPYSGGLVASLGAPLFTPGGQEAAGSNPMTAHVDENKHDARPGISHRTTYQGLLYIWPATRDTSATVVWPGSHLTWWPHMMRDTQVQIGGAQGRNYSELAQMLGGDRALELARGWEAHARRVPVRSGALLLWDQRTIHAGWRGGPRLAQAVCLEPAERRAAAERLAKLRLAALGLPGCHWASAGVQHDMCPAAPGAFASQRVAAEEGDGDPDTVVLPLRPCIRPQPLAEGADLEALQELVHVECRHVGMWEPTPGSEDLLVASVRADFQRLL